jgi:hypothetical protein
MRGVSRWASRVAPLLAVFVTFGVSAAWAGETQSPPTDPPQIRLQPPGGVTAQIRLQPPGGVAAQIRLQPPVGVQSRMQPPGGGAARVSPPGGAPMTLADMILIWLQSRISIPHG